MPDLSLTVNNKWKGLVVARVYYTPKDGVSAGQAVAVSGDLYCPRGLTRKSVTVPDNADTSKPWALVAWYGSPDTEGTVQVYNRTFAFSAPKQTVCLGSPSTASQVLLGVLSLVVFVLIILALAWMISYLFSPPRGFRSAPEVSAPAGVLDDF